MSYSLLSLKTSRLNKSQIIQTCKLKNSQWKFGINSQLKWFKKNTKNADTHNLMYLKSKLIGYTFLSKKSFFSNYKLKKYILFDTLIIQKYYRNNKLSNLLMNFNNIVIKETGLFSF